MTKLTDNQMYQLGYVNGYAFGEAYAKHFADGPVAWMDVDGNFSDNNDYNCFPIPLYAHAPQRSWTGLSAEEFKFIASKYLLTTDAGLGYFQEELEAKLREKNT